MADRDSWAMMIALYILLTIVAIATVLLLLHLRVRFVFGSGNRLLFVGLGRSGPEFDYVGKTGCMKLFGLKVHTFKLGKKKLKPPPEKEPRVDKKVKKAKRKRSPGDFLRLIPACGAPLWKYLVSLLRAAVVEELEGEIEGGFESPDLTGIVFGCYQAALSAVPAVAGRVHFRPDWGGSSLEATVRGSVALPAYKIVFRTLILLFQLPLRELIKLAIGKKKGGQDGE